MLLGGLCTVQVCIAYIGAEVQAVSSHQATHDGALYLEEGAPFQFYPFFSFLKDQQQA